MIFDADDPRNPDNNPDHYWFMPLVAWASIMTAAAFIACRVHDYFSPLVAP